MSRTGFSAGLLAMLLGGTALAQDAWVQIEAKPDLAAATARAAEWAGTLPDVAGFAMSSGWFGIALGPYPRDEARERLGRLVAGGEVPADSYLTDGTTYRDRFWPATAPLAVEVSPTEQDPAADLDAEARMTVQRALKWFGFYNSTVDGEFGRGTRAAISAWQTAQGAEASSDLTPDQQARLVGAYVRAQDEVSHAMQGQPDAVVLSDEERSGMLEGLEVTRPDRTRSGFYVDGKGSVLTTAEAVAECARITIERDIPVRLLRSDEGMALLAPERALAPPVFARFRPAGQIGDEVVVAGYSYGDALPAPALTFGTLAAAEGLAGEPVARLNVAALEGDTGGPVLDSAGAVVGMLLPKNDGSRVLPPEVGYALPAADLSDWLTAAGIASGDAALEPEAGLAMTVLVSCWR